MSMCRSSEGYFNHETNIIIEDNRNTRIHSDINEYEGKLFLTISCLPLNVNGVGKLLLDNYYSNMLGIRYQSVVKLMRPRRMSV